MKWGTFVERNYSLIRRNGRVWMDFSLCVSVKLEVVVMIMLSYINLHKSSGWRWMFSLEQPFCLIMYNRSLGGVSGGGRTLIRLMYSSVLNGGISWRLSVTAKFKAQNWGSGRAGRSDQPDTWKSGEIVIWWTVLEFQLLVKPETEKHKSCF